MNLHDEQIARIVAWISITGIVIAGSTFLYIAAYLAVRQKRSRFNPANRLLAEYLRKRRGK